MTDYALEIDAWTGAAVERLRFASRTLAVSPAAIYLGKIVDPGMLSRGAFDNITGRGSASTGAIVLNNQNGALDRLVNYGFDGRAFVLREVGDGPATTAPVVARGILAGIDTSDAFATLRLRLRDGLAALGVPLLSVRYAGTTVAAGGGAEGDANLKGSFKPETFGSVTAVSPKPANLFDLVRQVAQHPVASIAVFDGAKALTPGPDFPTLSGLLGWTQVPGSYATCLAAGLYRLGGSPFFTETADVVEGATLADRSAARVAQRILAQSGIGTVDAASFDTLHAAAPYEVGIYVDTDATVFDLASQVLASVGAALVSEADGTLRAVRLEEPAGTPVDTFTLRQISGGELALSSGPSTEAVPAWSVSLNWGKVYQVASGEDLVRDGVEPVRAALIRDAIHTATVQDPAVQVAHPLASTLTIDTLLMQQADAQAEAARFLTLVSKRRDRLTLTVSDRRGRLPIGALVSVRISRFGYDLGKLFRVVARQDDFGKRTVQLGLWG